MQRLNSRFKLFLFTFLIYTIGVLSYKYNLPPISTLKNIKNYFFPYEKTIDIYSGFKDISNRVEVNCNDILNSSRVMVVLIAGQSNAANSTNYRYTPQNINSIYNYNFFNNKCYKSLDPLLGASYSGGSSWNLLSDRLINNKIFDKILLIPVAVGNTDISQWSSRGELHFRIENSIDAIHKKNIKITHIFWHQGEADNKKDTSKNEYKKYFLDIKDSIRGLGVDAPIFIAIASRDLVLNENNRYMGTSQVIQSAQKELIAENSDIYFGANSDIIFDRYDFIHLSKDGAVKHSNMWFDSIVKFSRTTPK